MPAIFYCLLDVKGTIRASQNMFSWFNFATWPNISYFPTCLIRAVASPSVMFPPTCEKSLSSLLCQYYYFNLSLVSGSKMQMWVLPTRQITIEKIFDSIQKYLSPTANLAIVAIWEFQKLALSLWWKSQMLKYLRVTFSIRDFSSEAVMFPSPSQSNSLNAFQRIISESCCYQKEGTSSSSFWGIAILIVLG